MLYCCVLYYTALYCTVLYCTALYCIVLHCIALHCIALYCIVLYCIVLFHREWLDYSKRWVRKVEPWIWHNKQYIWLLQVEMGPYIKWIIKYFGIFQTADLLTCNMCIVLQNSSTCSKCLGHFKNTIDWTQNSSAWQVDPESQRFQIENSFYIAHLPHLGKISAQNHKPGPYSYKILDCTKNQLPAHPPRQTDTWTNTSGNDNTFPRGKNVFLSNLIENINSIITVLVHSISHKDLFSTITHTEKWTMKRGCVKLASTNICNRATRPANICLIP